MQVKDFEVREQIYLFRLQWLGGNTVEPLEKELKTE